LDASLSYKAGQYANLYLTSLGTVARSYSFATPVQADSQLRFFIRAVAGGAMSSLVNQRDLVGEAVEVEGPHGDFWLRAAESPLLLAAGGSGLAPILAMLQDAADKGVQRPVTLLFGAQQQRDLYALDQIAALAQRWPTRFTFVPVLSDAQQDSQWQGRRGMVDSQIAALLPAGAQAYLCGPPPMVDACSATLLSLGVAPDQIYADRFVIQGRTH
ncbi:MAG: FAD-binding oxidoreductase, partial [Sphingomonadaceae bacterium]